MCSGVQVQDGMGLVGPEPGTPPGYMSDDFEDQGSGYDSKIASHVSRSDTVIQSARQAQVRPSTAHRRARQTDASSLVESSLDAVGYCMDADDCAWALASG